MTGILRVARLVACGVLNIALAANAAAADRDGIVAAPAVTADRGAEPVVQCDPLPPLNIG